MTLRHPVSPRVFKSCVDWSSAVSDTLLFVRAWYRECAGEGVWDIHGVATISRLLEIIGLFCKRALYKRRYSAKETYIFQEPTTRSHSRERARERPFTLPLSKRAKETSRALDPSGVYKMDRIRERKGVWEIDREGKSVQENTREI